MRALNRLRSKKYFLRIVSSFMLVVLLLIATAIVLYFNAQNNILGMQYDNERKVLAQMNYNIEHMNNIVKDIAVSLFNDDDLIALKSGGDISQSILKIDRLNRLVAASPFLHSIVYYNSSQQRYFSSLNHNININDLQSSIAGYIEQQSPVPKLRLIPLKLNPKSDAVFDMFSFFIYDGDTLAEGSSALVLNVDPGWMLDNIEALNEVTERGNDVLFVTDSSGNVLISNQSLEPEKYAMKDELHRIIADSGRALDSFPYTSGGKKYQVSFLMRGLNDWQIISMQDYDEVRSNISRMRWTAGAITLAVALMAVLLSIYSSVRLYKPVGKLFSKVSPAPSASKSPPQDELTAIATSYEQINDKLKKLELEQASESNVAKAYHLRSLITGSKEQQEDQLRQLIERYGLDLAISGRYLLAVVKLDHIYALSTYDRGFPASLYGFAVSNIGAEMLRQAGHCEAVEPRKDHLVFLVSSDGELEADEAAAILRSVQETVERYYHIGCTISVSPVFDSYRDITEQYSLALRYSGYRMVLGKGAFIDKDGVRANEENKQIHIPKELERELTECVRSADRTGMEAALRKWTDLVCTFNIDHIHSALLHLVVTMNNMVAEMNSSSLNPIEVDVREMNRRAMEMDTLEEIRIVLTEFVHDLFDQRETGREDKKKLLADTMKEIVGRHSTDPDLNVQRIADMLRMNHIYVGQVFKEREGKTVVDFINETRLVHAKQLLEQMDLTVAEITEKSGFGSESYFYRLFKRRYGLTPKEFRFQHTKRNI